MSQSPSTVVWNAIVPTLGIALVLGAPLLPAVAIAAVASLAIVALLGSGSPRGRLRVPRET